MIPLPIFLILSFFLFSFKSEEVENIQPLLCDHGDMKALIEFSQEFELRIDGWEIDASSPNCCTWSGVTCIADNISTTTNTGRVVQLELQSKRLKGILSESLGSLEHLKTLNLSINLLESSIPVSLLHLPHLEVLDLSSNYLFGSLPDSMNLPGIQVFDISNNNFKGLIPGGVCSYSPRISVLNLGVNYFEGAIPDGLGNCSSLIDLNLDGNDLTGAFPDALFRLKGLAKLDIQSNKISGQLEPLSKLSNLVHLDISLNTFLGNLPDFFQEFGKLGFFSAHSNNFSGEIPLSLANSPVITFLYLGNNSLSGNIQINCSAMASLSLLDLGSNNFTGNMPSSLFSCRKLKTLNLARLNLSGSQLPEEMKNLQSLSSLSLSNTGVSNISSALETLQHCKNLTTLILTANFYGEEIPQDLTLNLGRLKILSLANCGLTGKIPEWLKGCHDLQILDLSVNGFQGQIPTWFQDMQSLFYLDVSNNKLSGDIPVELTTLQSFISSESNTNSTSNASFLDGSPFGFALYLKRNKSENAVKYNQLFSFPKTIDLSNNELTGGIPKEFGRMIKLQILDLNSNNLTGTIPSELGDMKSLTDLDLSHNNLSGPIPPSFTFLSFLRKFSVAYNNISGAVPTGGQFGTFNRTSFEGNKDLCVEVLDPCFQPRFQDHQGSPPLDTGDDEYIEVNSIDIAIGVGIFFLVLSFSLEMYFSFIWNLVTFHHNSDRAVPIFDVLSGDITW